MNHLIADIGNTRTKAAVYSSGKALDVAVFEQDAEQDLVNFALAFKPVHAIVSTVRKEDPAFLQKLNIPGKALILDHHTPIPIINAYQTPESLGKDRLAAAIGAYQHLKGKNCLIIDAGTCITYDLLTGGGVYVGGAISPGAGIRFKALHQFTGKLPHLETETNLIDFNGPSLTGDDTRASILSGVWNSLLFEMEGFILRYREQFSEIEIVLTGGNAPFFESRLKFGIFALPNLVMDGLNEILCYNVSEAN